MEIGENIRKYRREKNLTQEEMAKRLGVTAPAVNKWENGNSCPDIALLAPIARLLDISLDTLLSFQSELTEEEIKSIIAEVDASFSSKTIEETFLLIGQYLAKYPNSSRLAWQLALTLDVRCMFSETEEAGKYDSFILECYLRALESKEEELRHSAADSLYSYYIRKEQYEEAQKCLEFFSKENPERKRKQADLFRKTGRIQEAYKTYEELVFTEYQMLSMELLGLYMLAMEEKNMEKAHFLVEKQVMLEKLFEMGEYYEASRRLDLATAEKNKKVVLDTAQRMLKNVDKIGDFRKSPLYEHMQFKNTDENFLRQMKQNLIQCFKDQEAYGFMKDEEIWQGLLKRFSGERTDEGK